MSARVLPGHGLARSNVDLLDRLLPFDLPFARRLLGSDTFGRQMFFARDACSFRCLLCCDVGLV